jgi:hypothetical protein
MNELIENEKVLSVVLGKGKGGDHTMEGEEKLHEDDSDDKDDENEFASTGDLMHHVRLQKYIYILYIHIYMQRN